jgi:hypothetical protein
MVMSSRKTTLSLIKSVSFWTTTCPLTISGLKKAPKTKRRGNKRFMTARKLMLDRIATNIINVQVIFK